MSSCTLNSGVFNTRLLKHTTLRHSMNSFALWRAVYSAACMDACELRTARTTVSYMVDFRGPARHLPYRSLLRAAGGACPIPRLPGSSHSPHRCVALSFRCDRVTHSGRKHSPFFPLCVSDVFQVALKCFALVLYP